MGSRDGAPVVVITGASSGIGKATALRFAEEGATLVLASRRKEALDQTAREIEARGGQAHVAPTDVADEENVRTLARTAAERFGGIDVWVNNAAVTSFGRIEETPTPTIRRILETNVMGYVHGAKAALPHFRARGRGVLVMVSSVISNAPQPYTAAYGMSKAAVRRLAASVRMELLLEGADGIHVCTIMPAGIDTPLFDHAANYTGRAAKALNPTYSADEVARAIVRVTRRPKRETVVGKASVLASVQNSLAPALYERMAARQIDRDHLQSRPAEPTDGNVFEPLDGQSAVSGGWEHTANKARMAALGLAVLVPAGLLLWSRPRVREALTGGAR